MTSAFDEEKPCQGKFYFLAAFMILPLLLALMSPQAASASAGGEEIAIEMIGLQAERQMVDVDGDGQLDAFSADFVVYADGRASGTLYKNFNFQVAFDSGSIEVDPNGDLIVTVHGVDEHEVGHTLGFRHEHISTANACGTNGLDIILFDIVDAAGHANSFEAKAHVYHR